MRSGSANFLSGYKLSELRAGEDAPGLCLLGRVTVPISETVRFRFAVEVELGDEDRCGMRPAFLTHEEIVPISLGYIGPSDGRWVLRDLVLAELIGRFNSRPECDDQPCKYASLWTPTSPQAVADTWDLIVHGRCHEHWREYELASQGDDDLVPVL